MNDKYRNKKGQFTKGIIPWNIGKTGKYNLIHIDESLLRKYYLDECLSIRECAEKFECSTMPIRQALIEYNIPKRKTTRWNCRWPAWNKGLKGIHLCPENEFKVGDSRITGENNPNWKGGVSKFNHLIRNSVDMDKWRDSVFKRDNWTCQLCHERGIILRAHHIKSYSDIINEYNIKSVDDARKCDELWGISNGITLCHDCHWWVHRVNPLNQQ